MTMTKKYLVLTGAVFAIASTTQALAEPLHYECGAKNGVEVKIVGRLGDLVEVWDHGARLYNAYVESRDQMGGASGALRCDDVKIVGDVISIRMGWKNDLVQAYFLSRNKRHDAEKLQQLIWNDRDGVRNTEAIVNGDILLRYGRKQDLRTRLCSNYKNTGEWWYSSVIPRTGDYPACNSRFPSQKAMNVAR